MLYVVELPEDARGLLYDGKYKYVVSAASAGDALALVKASTDQDLDVVWDNADVDEAVNDLEGYTFSIDIDSTPVEYIAAAGDDYDTVAGQLTLALIADGRFVGSNWAPLTPNAGQIVIDAGLGGVGDLTVTPSVLAPDGVTDVTSLFFGDIVHEDNGLVHQIALDLEGYKFEVQAGALATATYVGLAGDTLDDVGTALAAALAAAGGGGVYTGSAWTMVGTYGHLLVDSGTAIGDLALTLTVTAPDGVTDVTADFEGTVVESGVAADPLSVDLMAGVVTTVNPLSIWLCNGTIEAIVE